MTIKEINIRLTYVTKQAPVSYIRLPFHHLQVTSTSTTGVALYAWKDAYQQWFTWLMGCALSWSRDLANLTNGPSRVRMATVRPLSRRQEGYKQCKPFVTDTYDPKTAFTLERNATHGAVRCRLMWMCADLFMLTICEKMADERYVWLDFLLVHMQQNFLHASDVRMLTEKYFSFKRVTLIVISYVVCKFYHVYCKFCINL